MDNREKFRALHREFGLEKVLSDSNSVRSYLKDMGFQKKEITFLRTICASENRHLKKRILNTEFDEDVVVDIIAEDTGYDKSFVSSIVKDLRVVLNGFSIDIMDEDLRNLISIQPGWIMKVMSQIIFPTAKARPLGPMVMCTEEILSTERGAERESIIGRMEIAMRVVLIITECTAQDHSIGPTEFILKDCSWIMRWRWGHSTTPMEQYWMRCGEDDERLLL